MLLTNTGPLVLDDGETASYHNDLRVVGRLPGNYTCQIKDNHGAIIDNMDYIVQGSCNGCKLPAWQALCSLLESCYKCFMLSVFYCCCF